MTKKAMKNQPGTPVWLQLTWSTWLSEALIKAAATGINQNSVASAAGVDASYLAHMKRGIIPRRDMAEAIGEALGRREEALLMAGYLPHRGCLRVILEAAAKKQPCPS